MSDKSVIIIGGGLGGLVTGSLLAKEGFKVIIVEKNHHVGGGLQSFKRFGATFDTGMHIFGGMMPDGNIHKICQYLNILDKFQVRDLDPVNTVEVFISQENKTYNLSLNSEHFVESFSKYFPEERQNLIRYQNAVRNIMEEFNLFYLRTSEQKELRDKNLGTKELASQSTENSISESENKAATDFLLSANDFISRYIKDPGLQSLLAIVNTLYAGEKDISPAFLHAALTTIFMKGACRVAGGYSSFANALVDFIKEHRGEIIVDQRIDCINTEGRKAIGVTTNSGITLAADYIVSAIPLSTMVEILDNKSLLSNPYKSTVASKVASTSAFIINIKLKKDTLPYSDKIGFFLENQESVWSTYDGSKVEKFMFMTPPVLNQGEYAETLNIILPMEWDVVQRWENTKVGNRGIEYVEFKQNLYQEIIQKLSRIIPNISDCIEAVDTSTPLTIRDYTGVKNGGMCGDRKDCRDPLAIMPVFTRIPNLFVTGQNVNMHGFCGVTLTAIQTCEAMLGKDYIVNKINLDK